MYMYVTYYVYIHIMCIYIYIYIYTLGGTYTGLWAFVCAFELLGCHF